VKTCVASLATLSQNRDYIFFDERFQKARRIAASWSASDRLIGVQGDVTPWWTNGLDRTTREYPLNLRGDNVIQNAATIRSLVLDAALFATKSQYYSGEGPIPDSVAKQIMADQEIGMWNFCGALYGPPPITDALWTAIRDSFASIPGVKFYVPQERKRRADILIHRADTMRGIPKLTEFGFLNWNGGGGHVGFSPVSPTTGKDAVKQFRMVSGRVREYGFDYTDGKGHLGEVALVGRRSGGLAAVAAAVPQQQRLELLTGLE